MCATTITALSGCGGAGPTTAMFTASPDASAGAEAGTRPSAAAAPADPSLDASSDSSPDTRWSQGGDDSLQNPAGAAQTWQTPDVAHPAGGAAGGMPGYSAGTSPDASGSAADQTTRPWTETVRSRRPSTAKQVLATAPKSGPVTLVTVREQDGKPVIETVTAANRTEAEQKAGSALADPGVLGLNVQTTVKLADVDPSPATSPSNSTDSPGSPDGADGPDGAGNPAAPRAAADSTSAPSVAAGSTASGTTGATVGAAATDPLRSRQWALSRLKAEQVWAAQPGNGLMVAVLDTGVYGKHPDLSGVVLGGTDLVAPGNGQADPNGHGTHIAGLIAAKAGNGVGGAGLAQGVRILPVRVLGGDGVGTDTAVAKGIAWSVDRGAKVINLSVGSAQYSAAEDAAVSYALTRGVVMVSAAGNLRRLGNPTLYPAAFNGVIAVGSSDRNDAVSYFSGTGSWVDLVAPGRDILSTVPTAGYAIVDGTSMSTPLVSAVAALVKAALPAASSAQVNAILTGTAQDLGAKGRDNASGYGMVAPVAAIARAKAIKAGDLAAPAPAPKPVGSALQVVSAPKSVGFRGTAKVTFRLLINGKVAPATPATACVAAAPNPRRTCRAQTTNAQGLFVVTAAATGSLTVNSMYAGAPTIATAASAPVLIPALAQVRVSVGSRKLTASVNPVVRGSRVLLQRAKGSKWVSVTSKSMPSSGRVTFTGLNRSLTYRVAVPASDRTTGVNTGGIKVR